MAGWTWAAWRGRPEPSGSARLPHEALRARGPARQLPAEDPFYEPPPGFEHARPGTVLRSRDVELAFLGLIPQKFRATQLLYRTTDLHGEPEATVTTVMVPAERAARGPLPGGLLPVRHRRRGRRAASRPTRCVAARKAVGAVAQFEFLLVAAALAEGWAVSVPDHEGTAGMWGAPYEPGYHVLDGVRAALNHERLGLSPTRRSACGATPAAGWPPHGPPRCSGAYAPGTQRRRRGARLARRRPRPHLPPPQRQHLRRACPRWWSPRCPTSIPTWTGSSRSTPPTRARRLLAAAREDDHRRRRWSGLAGKDMGDLIDRPLEEILLTPEVQHVFDSIKLGTCAPTAAGADRAGRARPDHLGRRHRRAGRDLHQRAAPASPTTATCSASTCCCTRCRRR